MILRRLYLYLVSAASLAALATGLCGVGMFVLIIVFNGDSASYNRSTLAGFTAMTVVALPVWAIHFWFARRFAYRDPAERASAIRRLYLYLACLALSIGAVIAFNNVVADLLRPLLDCGTGTATGEPFQCTSNDNWLMTSQAAWITAVLLALWAFHYRIAGRDRAAVGEHGRSASLRRWYMYPALLIGLLMMLSGASGVIELGWLRIINSSLGTDQYRFVADSAGTAAAGAALWGFHARAIAVRLIEDDRKSTLRALEGFLAVLVCTVVALIGASQILYYTLARLIGVSNPGGTRGDVIALLAQPASLLLVYGIAQFLIRRRLARDIGRHEADRQAGIRRLYTNLVALVSMAVLAVGAGGVLWTLAEQVEAPLIGVNASDWKDPISRWVTLLIVGAVVWLTYWRHAPWAGDRQSLSRRLYVWAALLASVLAALGSGIALLNVVLQQVFSANPRLNSTDNLDFGHYMAALVVALAVGFYHWRVLRADGASRPPKHEPEAMAPAVPAAAVASARSEPVTVPTLGRRYILSVVDATEDDVHQALASLPPAASYHLIPEAEV